MEKSQEPMKLIFTSFRNSIGEPGLKVAIDRHTPKMCSYPVVPYLVVPTVTKSLTQTNMERLCETILDNNWELIQDFLTEVYELGLRKLVLCDWATAEQIAGGKLCMARTMGEYIQSKSGELEFPIEIEYTDGR